MWPLHLLSDEDVVLPILTGHTRFIYYLFIFLFFLGSLEQEEMPYEKKMYCGRLKMQKEEKKFLDCTHTVHTTHRESEKNSSNNKGSYFSVCLLGYCNCPCSLYVHMHVLYCVTGKNYTFFLQKRKKNYAENR